MDFLYVETNMGKNSDEESHIELGEQATLAFG